MNKSIEKCSTAKRATEQHYLGADRTSDDRFKSKSHRGQLLRALESRRLAAAIRFKGWWRGARSINNSSLNLYIIYVLSLDHGCGVQRDETKYIIPIYVKRYNSRVGNTRCVRLLRLDDGDAAKCSEFHRLFSWLVECDVLLLSGLRSVFRTILLDA